MPNGSPAGSGGILDRQPLLCQDLVRRCVTAEGGVNSQQDGAHRGLRLKGRAAHQAMRAGVRSCCAAARMIFLAQIRRLNSRFFCPGPLIEPSCLDPAPPRRLGSPWER